MTPQFETALLSVILVCLLRTGRGHLRIQSSTNMRKPILTFLLLTISACLVSTAVLPAIAAPQQSDAPAIVEQGKFTLHKFEQPIGQETYEIRRDGDSLAVKMDFKFTDRGTPVPLSATFRCAADLTPQAFEIKGQTARPVSIDEALTIEAGKVHFRTRDKQSDLAPPSGPFFTIAGYAPATMQMLMVRYWATHGSPAQLATLPSGTVKIEPRRPRHDSHYRQRRRQRREARPLHHRRPDLGTRDSLVRCESQSGRRHLDRRRIRPLRSHSRGL